MLINCYRRAANFDFCCLFNAILIFMENYYDKFQPYCWTRISRFFIFKVSPKSKISKKVNHFFKINLYSITIVLLQNKFSPVLSQYSSSGVTNVGGTVIRVNTSLFVKEIFTGMYLTITVISRNGEVELNSKCEIFWQFEKHTYNDTQITMIFNPLLIFLSPHVFHLPQRCN